jgi:hypothetical protein
MVAIQPTTQKTLPIEMPGFNTYTYLEIAPTSSQSDGREK